MTPHQLEVARAFKNVTFPPGTASKRIAHTLIFWAENQPDREISERMEVAMNKIAYRFRRQMPSRLVPATKPQ